MSTEEPEVPKTTAARNEEVGEILTIGSSSLRIVLGGLQRVGAPSSVVAPDGAKISSQRLELSGSSSVLVISTVVIDEQEFAAAAGQTPENTAKVGSRTGVLQRPDPGAEDYAFAFWEGGAMVTIAGTGVKDNEVESLANAVLTVETVISS